jgi:hypothetical protein
MSADPENRPPVQPGLDKQREVRIRPLLIVALALVVGVVVWLLLKGGDDDKTSQTTGTTTTGRAVPSLVSEADLTAYAKSVDHPVYWAGPRNGFSYELTKTSDGSAYIRYLPQGVAAGDPRPQFLTVGTYPRKNAFATVEQAAGQAGASSVTLPGGGIGVPSPRNKQSVYMSYPESPVLVEVFSTSPARSLRLVRQQKIVPLS